MNLVFDRRKLLDCLSSARSTIGSKIDLMCNQIRFAIIGTGLNPIAYIYGTNKISFICLCYGELKDGSQKIAKDEQYHFLLDYDKFVKILKSSTREDVTITETQKAVYDANNKLTTSSRFKVQTEARNFINSLDVLQFPDEDFEGTLIAEYESGIFPKLWEKGSVARGALDVSKTCLHYDGNFFTNDGAFACIIQTEKKIKNSSGNEIRLSINLESGISEVIQKMLGPIKIMVSATQDFTTISKIYIVDELTGIYLATGLSQTPRMKYENILTGFEYPGKMVVNKEQFRSALDRAQAFVDKNYSNGIFFDIQKTETSASLKISTQEDDAGQRFEEDVPLIECKSDLHSRYNVINLLKSLDVFDGDTVSIFWRETKTANYTDNTIKIVEDGIDHKFKINTVIPSMIGSRQQ